MSILKEGNEKTVAGGWGWGWLLFFQLIHLTNTITRSASYEHGPKVLNLLGPLGKQTCERPFA